MVDTNDIQSDEKDKDKHLDDIIDNYSTQKLHKILTKWNLEGNVTNGGDV